MEALHYYECHITLEPIFDDRLEFADRISKAWGFKIADLLMKKRNVDTEVRSSKDTFMTAHSKHLGKIREDMSCLIRHLKSEGFVVWRYKIEDIVLDSRIKDELNLISL
jgi:hypothetical protein